LQTRYTGEDFIFNSASFRDVADRCGNGTKDVTLYFKILGSGTTLHNAAAPKYTNGDILKCAYQIPLLANWGTPQFTFSASADPSVTPCTKYPTTGTPFDLDDIYVADFTNKIAFEIYERQP
jgi:hypothetical protein